MAGHWRARHGALHFIADEPLGGNRCVFPARRVVHRADRGIASCGARAHGLERSVDRS